MGIAGYKLGHAVSPTKVLRLGRVRKQASRGDHAKHDRPERNKGTQLVVHARKRGTRWSLYPQYLVPG